MCGIVGIATLFPQKLSQPILSATRQMKRRGPDDEGFLLIGGESAEVCYGSDTALNAGNEPQAYFPEKDIRSTLDNNYHLALGHRRLSILDTSFKGHQPMSDSSRRYWIVFNGEIYNFKAIRKELRQLGVEFVSNTDTEVVLNSYIHWGESCLHKFNGMFAFSIFDCLDNTLFLARDRVGIKPLYYVFTKDFFIFASDIKTIIASEIYQPEVNWEGIYHNFSFSMTPRPNTSFKNLFSLRQGHYMRIDLATLDHQIEEYWDIPTGVQQQNMKESDAIEMLETELTQSVERQLIADVEVGTFMSGGVDSTTITAIASQLHPGIKAFTLAFDKNYQLYDELAQAKKTAQMCTLQHLILRVNEDMVLEHIDDIVGLYEEPFFHLPANFVISKFVRENNVKVILNGLGGDELFSGYGLYGRINLWRRIARFRNILKLLPGKISTKIDGAKRLSQAANIYQYYASQYSNYNDIEKKALFPPDVNYSSIDEICKQYGKKDKLFCDEMEVLNYLDLKSYIGNHHIHRTDQFAMHFSVEGRFPFLDHHLIEKSFTIPSKYKINNGISKYVLKQVAKKYIAPESVAMKKKGFGLPLEYWINHQLKPVVLNAIIALKNRGCFNNKAIDDIMQRNNPCKKWQLVMFELWYQKMIEQKKIN